jgi:hypothetical protein
MKKIINLILLATIHYFLFASRMTVLEESENGLLVEFQLPEYALHNVEHESVTYQKVICSDAIYLDKAGYPTLPYFAEAVGIPSNGSISMEIVSSEQTSHVKVKIIPAPYSIPKDDNLVWNIKEDMQAYRTVANYPEKMLQIGDIAYAGDRCLSSFRINPFQYSAGTQTLTVVTKMIFRIVIQGDKSRSRSWMTSTNYLDSFADELFLNNKTSKYWRYEQEKIIYHLPRNNEQISEIQFIIDEEGIYKITKEHLVEMLEQFATEREIEVVFAWDWNQIDPRNFELYSKKGIEPLHFHGEEDGSFDDGDFFEFFADRNYGDSSYYDEYTAENVYTLKLVNHLGARMAVKNGGIQNTNASQFQSPTSYQQTVHFEEQRISESLGVQWYYHQHNFYRNDRFFWDKVNAPDLKVYPFHLEYPAQTQFKKFTANVCLFGLTYTTYAGSQTPNQTVEDHNAIVRVNTALINQHKWNGQREKMFTNPAGINNDRLQHGVNNLYVSLPGSYIGGTLLATEQVMLDYFSLDYWREYKTDKDYIKFTKPNDRPNGLYQFTVQNFSHSDISVYKLGTAIFEHTQIEMDADNASFILTMQDIVYSLNDEYVAVTENQKKVPKSIRPNFPSRLKDTTNFANYVLITIEEFVQDEGAIKFKEVWENQGKQVKLVSTQDIYDEFNYGIRSAHAIKDFISYAYHNWNEPRLTHVLFLGDGIDDERDNSPNRHLNLIPFRYIWAEQRGRIASDNWYACIVGNDLIPDVSVSRIGIWEKKQVMEMANKTEHYLQNPNFQQQWHGNAIMCAGGNPGEGSLFAQQSESLKNRFLNKDYHVTRVYANTSGMPGNFSGTTSTLLQGINKGALFVSFMGHGGGYVWADYNLLNKNDVKSFNNDNYPLFISMSCFGGAFNGLRSSSIGEELVITAGKGGIAHIGFTGYGYEYADTLVFQYILDGIYKKKLGNIGQIADYTKTRFFMDRGYSNTGVALTGGFSLLGDNMIELLVPEIKHPVVLNKYNLTVGDTLSITANFPPDIQQAKFVIYDQNDVQLSLNQYFPYIRPVVNGVLSVNDFVVPSGSAVRKNYVKAFANGNDNELLGITNFTIGKSAVANLELEPSFPTALDSIYIRADFFDLQGVDSVYVEITTLNRLIKMIPINSENITYRSQNPIEPRTAGSVINFRFRIYDALGIVTISDTESFMINGPDLYIKSYEFSSYDMQPVFKVNIENIGTTASFICLLKLYQDAAGTILLNSVEVPPLEVLENRYIYLPIQNVTGRKQFRIRVNENQESFSEISTQYQSVTTPYYDINVFPAGLNAIQVESLDGNFSGSFPTDMLADNYLFAINKVDDKEPLNQPDLGKVLFSNSIYSPVYEVKSFNENIFIDSMQTLPNNKKVIMEFTYTNAKTNERDASTFAVYRWFEPYQKWLIMGGVVDISQNKVILHSDKLGQFAVFANFDNTPPVIQVNVQGQEFSQQNYFPNSNPDADTFIGGYVSRNGILSIILSDANGIDAFTNPILIEIDGNIIPQSEYTVSLSLGKLTSVPVKYKLENLTYGEHTLIVQCTDVNGNSTISDRIRLRVYEDFSVQNFANYPNPVRSKTEYLENEGRTRFTYVLTEDADDVKIKIYTVSGRLVKTFTNLPRSVGYHEYPRTVNGWDCRDDVGFYLANGVYFYKIIATKGSKKIEKMQKMAILK